jgi:hypothetical protein
MNLGKDEKGRFTEKNIYTYLKKNFKGGRPRLYDNPEDLLEKAFEYFEWADETQKGKYAEAELRLYVGFLHRESWREYKNNPKFTDTIYIIEAMLEGDLEKKLMWAGSTQGAIFKLKNKHGWKEEQHNNNVNQNITVDFGNSLHTSQESKDNT